MGTTSSEESARMALKIQTNLRHYGVLAVKNRKAVLHALVVFTGYK
jgi:hypothetical protein